MDKVAEPPGPFFAVLIILLVLELTGVTGWLWWLVLRVKIQNCGCNPPSGSTFRNLRALLHLPSIVRSISRRALDIPPVSDY